MRGRASNAVACAAVVGGMLVAAGPASAALTVSGTGDGGGCSLRATIEDVNHGSAGGCGTLEGGGTTIEVPAGHYTLAGTELQIEENMTIVGADPGDPAATAIDGAEKSRVLEVDTGVNAALDAVEVTGGATLHGGDSGVPEGDGLPGESGGGILNKGSLTLEHVLVTGNRTGRGGDGGNGTITNSFGRNGGQANEGGNGGGIDNESRASLVIRASTVSDNLTGEGGKGGDGSRGQVPAIGTIANGGDGGIGGEGGNGGGIYSEGSLSIFGSTISGNATGRGGVGGFGGEGSGPSMEFGPGKGGWGAPGGNSGLQYPPGSDTPAYAEFGGGGGIDSLGSLTIGDSTISGNHTGAGGLGGAAGMGGERPPPFTGHEDAGHAGAGGGAGLGGGLLIDGTGTSSLTNVTVSGNFTGDGGNGGAGAQSNSLGGGNGGFGGYGGGIWVYGPGKPSVQLNFVTVAGNHLGAEGQGGPDNEFPGFHGGPGKGAGIATGPGSGSASVTLANSIVGENAGDTNCNEISAGAIADGGHDLTSDGSCRGTVGNPLLEALANNGGPTETMLPGAGSPAIGIVPSGNCSPFEDQRGDPRPGSGKSACDAGAVETGGTGGGTTTTTTSLSSSANPSTVGASVTFTATVSPNPGGGTVEFTDGGSTISGCATKPVVAGKATCAETFGAAGSHSIEATFSGAGSFDASSSLMLTQVIEASSGGGGGGGEVGGGEVAGGGGPSGGGGGTTTGTGPSSSGGGSSGGGSPTGGSGTKGGPPPAHGKATIGAVKVKGTSVSVAVTCAGPKDVDCVVKLLLSASAPGGKGAAPRVVAAGAKGAKTVTVGTATASVPGGKTKTVTVSLDGAGKKALTMAGSLKATLTAEQNGVAKPLSVRMVTFGKG